ncbi:hypothetical protein F4811DRAFT_527230 [Daldinia bambusicola]|nr:hypothetical protein F4811DRAFT_527230 [Daldinia bambusicola]
MGERTGSRVFLILWSYVIDLFVQVVYIQGNKGASDEGFKVYSEGSPYIHSIP